MKRPRLQFSLRMLLLLMAVVGVGLTIYRWPWEEVEEFDYGGLILYTTSTYRRDWRGAKVKHGPETVKVGSQQKVEHYSVYEDGFSVLHQTYNLQGQLVEESRWDHRSQRNRIKRGDGEIWISRMDRSRTALDGTWERIIDRHDGQSGVRSERWPTGRFNAGLPLPADPIRLVEHWRADQQHGPTTWETMNGELLNTAEYEHDHLVRWNGQPVVEQFRAWVSQKLPAEHEFHKFMQLEDGWDSREYTIPFALQVKLKDTYPMEGPLIFFDGEPHHRIEGALRSEQQSVASAVTELAVRYGYSLSFRYGNLWLTPQVDAGSVFGDRTGVERIRFEPGSAAEREWQAPVITRRRHLSWPHILQHVVVGTSLQLDLSPLQLGTVEVPEPADADVRMLLLSRRDSLGHWLYLLGLRCEQQGTTLKITRRWEPLIADPPVENKSAPAAPSDPFG